MNAMDYGRQNLRFYTILSALIGISIGLSSLSAHGMFKAEQNGISVTLIDYHKHETIDLFNSDIWHGFPDNSFMVTPEYFKKKDIYPVGIIVHNKSGNPVKISQKSVDAPHFDSLFYRSVTNIEQGNEALGGCFIGILGTSIVSLIERGCDRHLCKLPLFATDNPALYPISRYPLTSFFFAIGLIDGVWGLRYSFAQDQSIRLQSLKTHLLGAETVLLPGQKVIKYTLLDRYDHGVDRVDIGILTGIKFRIFDQNDQECAAFCVTEYDHGA